MNNMEYSKRRHYEKLREIIKKNESLICDDKKDVNQEHHNNYYNDKVHPMYQVVDTPEV